MNTQTVVIPDLSKLLGVLALTVALAGCGDDSPGLPDVAGQGVAQCQGGGLSGTPIALDPAKVSAGSPGANVKITITGSPSGSNPTQFFSSDTILWNGSANGVGTTYLDPNDLSMTVPANLLSSSGSSAQITVQEICANGPNPTSQTLAATLTITVGIITTSPPNGVVGAAYSQTLSVAGGTTPYTWTLTSGTLPAGLTLNTSTGVISGTPTTAGTVSFTVQVTDASNQTDSKLLSVVIASAANPLSITTAALPNGTVGTAYNQALTATGGTPPYGWSWTAAAGSSLPPGLNLSSTGTISGTPTMAGTFNLTVQVQDQSVPNPQNTPAQFSLTISPAQAVAYAPGPVLSASPPGTANGPGLLVAIDDGVNAANNNHGIAAVAVKGVTIAAGVPFGTVFVQDTSGNWNAAAYLAAPPATTGTVPSIAISGDGNSIAAGFCLGSPCTSSFVYVYEVSSNNWTGTLTPVATLIASSRGSFIESFGFSVAVDDGGDLIAAGAPGDLTQGGDSVVCVFLRSGSSWSGGVQPRPDDVQLTATEPAVGISVSTDGTGDTIVAGAQGFGTVVNAGAAYIFAKPPGGWAGNGGVINTPTATLTQASTPLKTTATLGDYFGRSVAISKDGHTVAVGAPNYTNCSPEPCNQGGPGAVFVYLNSGIPSAWASPNPLPETAVLKASSGEVGDQLGFSTSISQDGSTIVAGAPSAPNGSCCTPGPGAIYVFRAPPGNWNGSQDATQAFAATAAQGVTPLPRGQFGVSVAIAGDATTLGAGGFATVTGGGPQVVYLFQ